jgi:hypothetical protein
MATERRITLWQGGQLPALSPGGSNHVLWIQHGQARPNQTERCLSAPCPSPRRLISPARDLLVARDAATDLIPKRIGRAG